MPWVSLDDQMAFNAKVVAAGNAAIGARDRMMCWSSAQKQDGKVPHHVALLIAGSEKALTHLVTHRLLDALPDGGFYVHDFLDWNLSASAVEARRVKRVESGRNGGRISGSVRSKREANAKQTLPKNEALASISGKHERSKHEPLSLSPSLPLPEESESAPALDPAPPLTDSERECFDALATGRDFYPVADVPDPELAKKARLIHGRIVGFHRPVEDPVSLVVEAVDYGRSWAAGKPLSRPDQAIAEVVRKVGWLLADADTAARAGQSAAASGTQRAARASPVHPGRLDPESEPERRQRLADLSARPTGTGGGSK